MNKKCKFLIFSLLLIFLLNGCNKNDNEQKQTLTGNNDLNFNITETTSEQISTESEAISEDQDTNIQIHYLDVGQANCTLIKYGNIEFLIDGGNYGDGNDITNYIKDLNVDNIEYVIATHPHEDHIGGLPKIMSYFSVDNIYTPYIKEEYKPTTKIYNSLNTIIDTKDIDEYNPNNGDIIYSDENLKFEILFDGRIDSNDLNDYSIVTKMTYKDVSFIFTGDSTIPSEELLLENNDINNLKADVLLIGHHGSSTSTSKEFLDAVSPNYCIISCGAGNEYGHPHYETLKKLSNITTYRTDLDGTIIATTNGKTIEFKTKCTGDYPLGSKDNTISSNTENKITENSTSNISEEKYIGNKNSKKLHKSTCNSLPSEKNSIFFNSIEEALDEGYEKCSNCFN